MESYNVQCFVTGFFHYVDVPHLFVHELADKHLSCFHLWDIMNNATQHLCREKFCKGKKPCVCGGAKPCSKWIKMPHYFLELVSGKFPPFLFSLRPTHHSYFKQAIIIHSLKLIHGWFVQQLHGILVAEEYEDPPGENKSVIVNWSIVSIRSSVW